MNEYSLKYKIMARNIDDTKIERIKTAALEMVVQRGFGGASISEIAKLAGVAEGYLYRHYKGKSDLVNDLLFSNLNELIDKLEKLLDSNYSTKDIFEQLIRLLFNLANHQPERIKFLYVLMHDYNFKIQEEQRERIFKLCTRVKEKGQTSGEMNENIDEEENEEEDNLPKICVVGRPNVGKSSFINALLGVERNIVTPIAGTTRDSIYTRYKTFGFDFYLVDTAGLRKKTKVSENIEFYSVMRSIRTIEKSDVCILMIDATQGFESQDLNIFSLVERNRKGMVILVNKWDLVEKDHNTHLEFAEKIREKIAPFNDVPIIFTSVISKQRIFKALETALEVYKNYYQEISTSKLNDWMQPILAATPPTAHKGKLVKIKYVTKRPTRFPAFVFFANLPQYVRDSYKRFLENQLREHFNYTGVPLEIFIRKK